MKSCTKNVDAAKLCPIQSLLLYTLMITSLHQPFNKSVYYYQPNGLMDFFPPID